MERAIIHSNLKKEEINPMAMMEKYFSFQILTLSLKLLWKEFILNFAYL